MKEPLPPEMLDLLEEVRAEAYATGHVDALRGFAREHARLELLGENWRERGIADYQAAEKRRRDEITARAVADRKRRNIAAGRHPDWEYRGQSGGGSGAVCWETGYPVETANAWLSRPRWMPIPTRKAQWIPPVIAGPLATVTDLRPTRPMPAAQQEAA